MEKSLEDIIQLSLENPDQIYGSDQGIIVSNGFVFDNEIEYKKYLSKNGKIFNLSDGRIIFDGQVFKDKREFELFTTLTVKAGRFFQKLDFLKKKVLFWKK